MISCFWTPDIRSAGFDAAEADNADEAIAILEVKK
jgi:hypothetical protein